MLVTISVLIFTCFESCVLFKDILIIIRRYFSYIFSTFVVYLLYHIRLTRLSGDIELNPGPKPSSFRYFSICHWNLNSIASHDFLKVKLLTACNIMHKFDIVIISQPSLQTMINWIYLVIMCPMLTILLEIDVREFVFIIKSLYLLKC